MDRVGVRGHEAKGTSFRCSLGSPGEDGSQRLVCMSMFVSAAGAAQCWMVLINEGVPLPRLPLLFSGGEEGYELGGGEDSDGVRFCRSGSPSPTRRHAAPSTHHI